MIHIHRRYICVYVVQLNAKRIFSRGYVKFLDTNYYVDGKYIWGTFHMYTLYVFCIIYVINVECAQRARSYRGKCAILLFVEYVFLYECYDLLPYYLAYRIQQDNSVSILWSTVFLIIVIRIKIRLSHLAFFWVFLFKFIIKKSY